MEISLKDGAENTASVVQRDVYGFTIASYRGYTYKLLNPRYSKR